MSGIVIVGAGGRAGRAVTAEARQRGHTVTAVLRDPAAHRDIDADAVVRGDVRDADGMLSVIRGHDAVVNAVSPASGPDALARLGKLDDEFFVTGVEALLRAAAGSGVGRLILIGLFATLKDPTGRLVLDDPDAFPSHLRPFALAHDAGLRRLRNADTPVDWLMLTPPALLDGSGPRTGHYRTGGDTVSGPAPAHLSYADLAVAVVDEVEVPTHHRTRVSVFN